MLFSSINFTKNKHLILVFFLAFCLRLIFLIFFEGLDTKFKEDPLDYYNVAKFAETNGITNWTSHVRPPLLSFIIIPIIKLFPENLELILIKFLMIFLSCITCITIYFLSLQISKNNKVKFQEGMVVSNEPGYYKKNKFGIRIENLIYVKKKKNTKFFENLTMVPIDKDLIETRMLNKNEKKWLID